jgi:hypothetical protein
MGRWRPEWPSSAQQARQAAAPHRRRSGWTRSRIQLCTRLSCASSASRTGELDDAISDLENDAAASRFNEGAYPELDDETGYDRVHDEADDRASRINNRGTAAQIAHLAEGGQDVEALRDLLRQLLEREPGSALQSV